MVHIHWHIVYWDAGPARTSDSVNPILLWTALTVTTYSDRLYIGPLAQWPCPVAAARYCAT